MSGWNPVTGHDAAPSQPPGAPPPYGGPNPGRGQAYIPHYGGPAAHFYGVPYGQPYVGMPQVAYGWGPQAAYGYEQYNPNQQYYSYPQPNGAGNIYARHPNAWPHIDTNMPASQMTNTTGGMGCEPGYNYFFPAEHTKVHVYRSETPPWQLPAGARMEFMAAHIPCNTTCAELLKGYGCTNEVKKKNNCFEIFPSGGGKWYKGLKINGANKDMMKTSIKDIGWDASRSGAPGEKPVVCLWFSKG